MNILRVLYQDVLMLYPEAVYKHYRGSMFEIAINHGPDDCEYWGYWATISEDYERPGLIKFGYGYGCHTSRIHVSLFAPDCYEKCLSLIPILVLWADGNSTWQEMDAEWVELGLLVPPSEEK